MFDPWDIKEVAHLCRGHCAVYRCTTIDSAYFILTIPCYTGSIWLLVHELFGGEVIHHQYIVLVYHSKLGATILEDWSKLWILR